MADLKEKTYVEDVDRSVYDMRDAENDAYRMESGLTPEIVEKLSKEKDDPVWIQQFRLESLQIYNEMKIPNWGPSIEGLDMDHIATYVRPNTKMRNDWKDVPEDIKETFERLGIPQAERKSLAGVGAQYDSELVYHNVKDSVAAEGVVYTDMESAIKGEYADMVRKYFMKLVTPRDHKFAALHGAVWSGGSFVYVPKGVQVSIPLLDVVAEDADLMVRFGAGHYADVEHVEIARDVVTPLASPAFVREHGPFERPEDLEGVPLLRSPLEPWRTWFAATGLDWAEPSEGSQFNDIGLMCDGAAAGMGVALVRLKLGAPWLENGTLVRLFATDTASPHAHYLCWRTGTMDRWECAAFAEWLRKTMA